MRRALQVPVLVLVLAIGAVTPAWAAPANDTFAAAESLTLPTTIGPVDTTGATTEAIDAEVAGECGVAPRGAATVWYEFTPEEDIGVRIGTLGSDYVVAGAVVTGAPGDFTAVRCFTDFTSFIAEAGVRHYLVLSDWNEVGGGTLEAQIDTGPAPTGTFAVTDATVAKRTGYVTLTGTITCNAGSTAYLSGNLSQRVGRVATIQSGFWLWPPVTCDGTAQPWSTAMAPSSGKFAGGKATLQYWFSVSNEFAGISKNDTMTVQLRGG